jgi:hypothetical protein
VKGQTVRFNIINFVRKKHYIYYFESLKMIHSLTMGNNLFTTLQENLKKQRTINGRNVEPTFLTTRTR